MMRDIICPEAILLNRPMQHHTSHCLCPSVSENDTFLDTRSLTKLVADILFDKVPEVLELSESGPNDAVTFGCTPEANRLQNKFHALNCDNRFGHNTAKSNYMDGLEVIHV